MKLFYIANQRLPTEKAYGVQISKMCEAFANSGVSVILLAPFRKNKIKEVLFEYYNVKENFKFKKIWAPDFYLSGRLDKVAVALKKFISAVIMSVWTLAEKADIFYSRDEGLLFLLSLFLKPEKLIFEAHKFSKARIFFYRRFKNINLKIVAISEGLKNCFVEVGFKPENILVARDGVDLSEFNQEMSKDQARGKFGLSLDKKLIGYVGALKTMGMEKGIRTAIESLIFLEDDTILVLVGGNAQDIEFYKKFSRDLGLDERVVFIGQVWHKLVPAYLKAFDAVIAPFPDSEHFRVFMSPLKLFEYMVSKRPIVASNLPSVREVLDDDNAVFAEADNPESFALSIKRVLSNRSLAEKISERAFSDVQNYTWQKRAEKILRFTD